MDPMTPVDEVESGVQQSGEFESEGALLTFLQVFLHRVPAVAPRCQKLMGIVRLTGHGNAAFRSVKGREAPRGPLPSSPD